MERTEFIDIDAEPRWWLIADEIERELEEPRRDLSSALGYSRDDPWFQDRSKVENLYDRLNIPGPSLLSDLDQAADLSTRSTWLRNAVDFLTPAAEDTSESSGTDTAPATSPEPPPPAAAPPPPVAPAKVSPFAKKQSGAAIDSAVEQVLSDVDLSPESIAAMLEIPLDEARELAATIPDNLAELLREQIRQQTGA